MRTHVVTSVMRALVVVLHENNAGRGVRCSSKKVVLSEITRQSKL